MPEFDLNPYFKAIVDVEPSAIVICDLDHIIRYMNPAAYRRYKNRGGDHLLGSNVFDCHKPESNVMIGKVMNWFKASPDNDIMYLYYSEKEKKDVYMISLRDDERNLIGYYEKHHYLARETKKPYEGLE